MKSSSINVKIPNIPNVREYRDELTNEWYLKPHFQAELAIYILRETNPSQLWFHLKDGELFIQGKQYSVTWINSPSECRKTPLLLISLRYCKHLERGFALIKILKGNGEYERLEY